MRLHVLLVMIPCLLLTVHTEEDDDEESKYIFLFYIYNLFVV
jgi:hypothetical protein